MHLKGIGRISKLYNRFVLLHITPKPRRVLILSPSILIITVVNHRNAFKINIKIDLK